MKLVKSLAVSVKETGPSRSNRLRPLSEDGLSAAVCGRGQAGPGEARAGRALRLLRNHRQLLSLGGLLGDRGLAGHLADFLCDLH